MESTKKTLKLHTHTQFVNIILFRRSYRKKCNMLQQIRTWRWFLIVNYDIVTCMDSTNKTLTLPVPHTHTYFANIYYLFSHLPENCKLLHMSLYFEILCCWLITIPRQKNWTWWFLYCKFLCCCTHRVDQHNFEIANSTHNLLTQWFFNRIAENRRCRTWVSFHLKMLCCWRQDKSAPNIFEHGEWLCIVYCDVAACMASINKTLYDFLIPFDSNITGAT